jgi:hypothetical protein
MSRKRFEIWWARGLWEGEGSFILRQPRIKKGQTIRYRQPVARLNMTDEDSVRRFGAAIGFGKVTGPHRESRPHHRPYYAWSVTGFEGFQALVAMLWPGLGQRRRQRATEVLGGFHATGAKRRGRWERR